MLDYALWLFNRKSPYFALFFFALFGWFSFTGYQDLQERSLLDRQGIQTEATVTRRYVEPATCPGETGLTAATCNTDKPRADFTFAAGDVTIDGSRVTSAVYNFMETQDHFTVTFNPEDPAVFRIETGTPRQTGWAHLPLGLALGPILMALMLALFWRKGGFARRRKTLGQ